MGSLAAQRNVTEAPGIQQQHKSLAQCAPVGFDSFSAAVQLYEAIQVCSPRKPNTPHADDTVVTDISPSTLANGRNVLLMSTNDRYQQFIMKIQESEVVFFRQTETEAGAFKQNLLKLRVHSIDTPDRKVMCPQKRHFSLLLSSSNGHRKLYFLTLEHL